MLTGFEQRRNDTGRPTRAWLLILAAVPILTLLVFFTASTGADDGKRSLAGQLEQEVVKDPQADQVLARVNGTEIRKRTVTAIVLFSQLPGAEGAGSSEEALAHLIDQALLRQAAERAGIIVTDSEADQLVAASLEPYRKGQLTPDEVALLDALFRAAGTSLAEADTSEAYRDALRGNLLIGRFLAASGTSRDDLLVGLRQAATIEILVPPTP